MFPGVCIAIPHWRDNGKQFSMRRSTLMEPRTLQYMAEAADGQRLTGAPRHPGATGLHGLAPGPARTICLSPCAASASMGTPSCQTWPRKAWRGGRGAESAATPVPDCGRLIGSTIHAGWPSATWRRDIAVTSGSRHCCRRLERQDHHQRPAGRRAAAKFRTLASHASFNNDIGVPTTLLELGGQHQVAVLEFGTNHPGELAPLSGWLSHRSASSPASDASISNSSTICTA